MLLLEQGGRAEPGFLSVTGNIDQLRWAHHGWTGRMNSLECSQGLKAHPHSICQLLACEIRKCCSPS